MSFNTGYDKFNRCVDKSFRFRYRIEASNDRGLYWQKYPCAPYFIYDEFDDACNQFDEVESLNLVSVRLIQISEKWFDGHGWVEVGTEVIQAKGKV
jgi:hypothetical protein